MYTENQNLKLIPYFACVKIEIDFKLIELINDFFYNSMIENLLFNG